MGEEAAGGLAALIARESARPVPAPVTVLAEAARERHAGGGGVLAVLAYGSTLREANPAESLVDLYVLTADFAAVSDSPPERLACRLAPPNVYYLEATDGTGTTWRAKCACLPLAQFARWVRPEVRNPYFWARFAQPCRIVWARDAAAREAVVAALASAVRTMLRAGLGLAGTGADCARIWEAALRATYASELRVEGPERARLIVDHGAAWFTAVCEALGVGTARAPAPLRRNWRLVRLSGKAWSVLRLVKAAFTFRGGADYLAWKIRRHTGGEITPTPWQRRHPLLAALWLLPKLLRRGAVR